jgi:ribose transport system permease protein
MIRDLGIRGGNGAEHEASPCRGDWLLSSFAAPIIGGMALSGGSVSVTGTVLAALIIRLVDVARAQFSLDPNWVNFVIGAVVLGTVVLTNRSQTGKTGSRRGATTGCVPQH